MATFEAVEMLRRTSFFGLRLESSILIDSTPAAAFAFFENMATNYTRWHRDHLTFEWRKGQGIAVGNEFAFSERIAGKLQRKRVRISEVRPDRYFAFQPTNPFYRFFLRKLSFGFEPHGEQFLFRAIIDLHGIGPIGTWINRRSFDAVEMHMAEEGLNLKAILEAGQESG